MKITTLGTSHGDPTLEHYCSSTLLETQGHYYLIDAGEPANATLVRRGLCASQLSAVFITHMHIDHTGSLPVLCEQAEKYRSRFPENTFKVYLPEKEAIEPLLNWRAANHSSRFKQGNELFAYPELGGYHDDVITMTPFPTDHLCAFKDPRISSYALKFELEGKKILFTGDLHHTCRDFPLEAAADCDLVFSEITHYNPETALPIFEKLTAKHLIFYHIHNPWQTPEGQDKILKLFSRMPYPVEFAFDGFSVNL